MPFTTIGTRLFRRPNLRCRFVTRLYTRARIRTSSIRNFLLSPRRPESLSGGLERALLRPGGPLCFIANDRVRSLHRLRGLTRAFFRPRARAREC